MYKTYVPIYGITLKESWLIAFGLTPHGSTLKHKASKFDNTDHRICNIFCHKKHKCSIACTCPSTCLLILKLSVNNFMLKTGTSLVCTLEDKEIFWWLPLWMPYWYTRR